LWLVNSLILPYNFYYGVIVAAFYPIFFLYMMAITSIAASDSAEFPKRILAKPKFWFFFTLVYVLLIFGIVLMGEAFLTELWQYIPYEEFLLRWIIGMMITSIPIALVLPALPLLFTIFRKPSDLAASEKLG
ncbi:MAG: hypothetical protein ACFFDP_03505, partial [Promethearchaeota archaeon]